MQGIFNNIQIHVNEHIYLRNPLETSLGKNIIRGSVVMIDELGFEDFTFKKLSQSIQTTEASIYRYFENKHKLLTYLTAWHWGMMLHRLYFSIANLKTAEEKLERAILLITDPVYEDTDAFQINEAKLYHLIVKESSKSYLTRMVDEENKAGFFQPYKNFVGEVSKLILEINPAYAYPHMLVSTCIEGVYHQRYFASHLPSLTDKANNADTIQLFYKDLIFKAIHD